MFSKMSFQRIILLIVCIFIVGAILLGIITRISYSTESKDINSILKAEVTFEEDLISQVDELRSTTTYEQALADLDQNEYVFYAKCLDQEVCYGCIKFSLEVIETLKGDIQETGKKIILYQLIKFDFVNNNIYFLSPDYTMPLQEGKTYLLFANKRNYDTAYQKTLQENEYSLAITGAFPTALVVNDTQNEYINPDTVKRYGDIKDLYYICFNETAMKNINELCNKIIKHYITS